ncbi:MAG: PQQ-binding-like beta-propeller repeat protein [Bacteroidetes bacterium]|nr:PQQ-binding-like beta-propeller repeat protein [Bacteroidota bacterium]
MSCGSLRLSKPVSESSAGWPMFGRNSLHTSMIHAVSSGLEKIWKRNVGAGFGTFSPTIMGGIVFVGTLRGDVDLLDVENGDEIASKNFGGAVFASPLVSGSLMIVASSEAKENLFAYDLLTGKTVWSKRIADVEASPVLLDSALYVSTVRGDMYKFDLKTGKEIFHKEFPAPIRVSPAVGDSLCVFGSDDGYVYAISSIDGKEAWKYKTGSMVWCSASMYDSLVFVGDNSGKLLALRRNGTLAYDFQTGEKILSMPICDGSRVYFGCNDGYFYALNILNGSLLWKVRTSAPIVTSASQTKSQIIFGGLDEKLYVVDKDNGKVVQKIDLDGRVRTGPAIYEHYLAVCTDNENVFGFKMK